MCDLQEIELACNCRHKDTFQAELPHELFGEGGEREIGSVFYAKQTGYKLEVPYRTLKLICNLHCKDPVLRPDALQIKTIQKDLL